MNQRPTLLDLLAGVSGLSLAFEQAVFDIAAALEIDTIHAAAHHYISPSSRVFRTDNTTIVEADLQQNIRKPVDVVFSVASCQFFSLIWQGALDDPRNQIVKTFVHTVVELQPKYYVLENVRCLTLGHQRSFLVEFEAEFELGSYNVVPPLWMLNAKDYGVPQDRRGHFRIKARKNARLPEYPTPIRQTKNWEEALGDLHNSDDFNVPFHDYSVERLRYALGSFYRRKMRCQDTDIWRFEFRRERNRSRLTPCLRTTHADISRRRFSKTGLGKIEPMSRFVQVTPDGVSNALRAGADPARGASTIPRPIHNGHNRCITVLEMARLLGFPDSFRFHASKWQGARQNGNNGPPPLSRAVTTEIPKSCGVELVCLKYLADSSPVSGYFSVQLKRVRIDRKEIRLNRMSNTALSSAYIFFAVRLLDNTWKKIPSRRLNWSARGMN